MRSGVPFALLLFAACSSTPPSKVDGAPKRAPDEAYETDGGHAYRVLAWRCDERNERVAMVQSCGEGLVGCGKWEIDRTLCPLDPDGRDKTRTPNERKVEAEGKGRHPIPDGSGWR